MSLLDLVPGVPQAKLIGLGVAAAGIAILAWSWHSRGEDVTRLTGELATANAATSAAVAAVRAEHAEVLRQGALRDGDHAEIVRLQGEKTAITGERDAAVAALNHWREKAHDEIIKRPDVFGRAASLRTRRLLRDIQSITGGGEDRDDGDAAKGGDPNPARP